MPISVSSRKKTVPVYAIVTGKTKTGGALAVGRSFGDMVVYTDRAGDGRLRVEFTEDQLRAALKEFEEARDRSAQAYAWVERAQAEAQS